MNFSLSESKINYIKIQLYVKLKFNRPTWTTILNFSEKRLPCQPQKFISLKFENIYIKEYNYSLYNTWRNL